MQLLSTHSMYTDDILGMLEEFDDFTTGDIISAFFCSPANFRQRRSTWLPPEKFKAAQERSERELHRKQYQRIANLLAYLKRTGFVERNEHKAWKLTEKGLIRLQRNATIAKYIPIARHLKKEEDHLKVVIFDIPEDRKKFREWLRYSLQNLGFELLQKSVWIGKTKLPQEFFDQLGEFELLACVHIFAIQDTGSIGFDI